MFIAPALATSTGQIIQSGAIIVVETTPHSIGAGLTLMSSVAKEGGTDGESGESTGRLRDEQGRFKSDPDNPPSPYRFTDAQRRAAWKELVDDPDSPLTEAQRAEIRARGHRGPQRVNEFGELETMELSHEPIPLREGGTEVVPRWPDEHAAIDPHRQLKKR